MKLMIMNSSGNVGKSTIARELFYPRMSDPLIVEVETVNKSSKDFGGVNVWQFRAGDNFEDLYLRILETENVIVDVGASQLGEFWRQIEDFAGVDALFDLFIVPTIPTDKVMTDTYKTIRFLRESGIEDEKIKVIFNQTRRGVAQDFAPLLKADFDFDEECYIKESKLFTDLGLIKKSVSDIFRTDPDYYKKKILEATDPKEKIILVKSDLANRMAHKVVTDFDFIFEKITGQAAQKPPVADDEPEEKKPKVDAPETPDESGVSEDDEEL